MQYPLAVSTWDEQEIQVIRDLSQSARMTMGPRVRNFEEEFAAYFGSRFAVMVNSGSSANLLAVAALAYADDPGLHPGDEVIVPAVSWSTTYAPLHQYGLRLRFVDIDRTTLNIDPTQVEAAITPNTRAIFAVNLLGNPSNLRELQSICEQNSLYLLEDNCESMGARVDAKYTGTFGVCGTFSTFFSHHICTMEGGLVITDHPKLYEILLSLRSHGWIRDLPEKNSLLDRTGDPFEDAYRFVLPGYNLRPLEMEGALGSCQLAKLPRLLAARRQNAEHFQELFHNSAEIQIQQPKAESSWFAFSFLLQGKLSGQRRGLVQRLTEIGVECRPVVAGNFTNNPVLKYFDYSISGNLTNSDDVDRNGFYLGNHHIDLRPQLDLVAEVVDDYARNL